MTYIYSINNWQFYFLLVALTFIYSSLYTLINIIVDLILNIKKHQNNKYRIMFNYYILITLFLCSLYILYVVFINFTSSRREIYKVEFFFLFNLIVSILLLVYQLQWVSVSMIISTIIHILLSFMLQKNSTIEKLIYIVVFDRFIPSTQQILRTMEEGDLDSSSYSTGSESG